MIKYKTTDDKWTIVVKQVNGKVRWTARNSEGGETHFETAQKARVHLIRQFGYKPQEIVNADG